MSAGLPPLRVAIVAGEESGDLLGADLVAALKRHTGRPLQLAGVGGRHLAEQGLRSLFDGSEIALMGFTSVVRRLPLLVRRIGQTAEAIIAFRPDVLITIDSPAFGLRVAAKVKARLPFVKAVHYVCPSVWAWAPKRAPKMAAYIDHVLCLLPFEPEALKRLNGPPGTFVGHRLTRDPAIADAAAQQSARLIRQSEGRRVLLVLPGSRRSEVSALLKPFSETIAVLRARGHEFDAVLPTVPHVARLVREAASTWPVLPEIVDTTEARISAFARADAAIAASGTVSLELALAGVPLISCYRTDALATLMMRMITVWSASLPNLVADWPVVPEYYNDYLRPEHMARAIEQLWTESPARRAQLQGFEQIRRILRTERSAGDVAAEVIAGLLPAAPAG
jgi:lipid-A-disaccharide synthase